jgi:hypothetical protein
MRYVNSALLLLLMTITVGCSAVDSSEKSQRVTYALPGTSTAVIGIPVNKDGIPQALYEEIILHPGQKVLFAGPDDFVIVFKEKKSINRKYEIRSSRGVVVIDVPKDILERPEFVDEFRKTKEIRFNYGIRVNGKELDPTIVIKRAN